MFPQFIFLTAPSSTIQSPLYDQKNQQIMNSLNKHIKQFNVVVVAFERNSIQFAYDILKGENNQNLMKKTVFLQALLQNRMNSNSKSASKLQEPKFTETQSNKYSEFYNNFTEITTSSPQPLQLESTLKQFSQRIINLKTHLLSYKQYSTAQRILIIGSKEVLNMLGATDFHQDGEPVNQLRLDEGELDMVSLVIDGVESIRELEFEGVLAFCK